jgi:membrane protease YdiL (CAAX protease family)
MNPLKGFKIKTTRPHLVGIYFVLTYLVSWTGAFLVAFPYLFQHRPVSKSTGLLMFPVMLLGPSLIGLWLTWMTGRTAGLMDLLRRIGRVKVSVKWYAILLLPPLLITTVLVILKTFVSSAFTPNSFFIGFSFGIAAGFLEEIGWTGYALPRMLLDRSSFRVGLLLGVLWGCWHLPVIDFLGAAFPHQNYLVPFMAAFIVAMTAIRIIIVWVYSYTRSLILAQLIHAISTGSLVALGPSNVTPAQETIWYASYAAALWVAVAGIYLIQRKNAAGADN